jgi:hypothetical protein
MGLGGLGDWETGRLGRKINGWELGIVREIGNTKLFTPTLDHLWKSKFVLILSTSDLR